jgi:general secretion pathway protein A
MYKQFYRLREKPFKLLPDPEFLFLSQGHENGYVHLKYAIIENKGFVVLTGEIGSGKTILINYFLSQIKNELNVGLINSTNLTPAQFIKAMCREFQLNINGRSKFECQQIFSQFLISHYKKRNRVALIVDEAQNLPIKTLEEIRMISNLETEKNHLIQIILVGQPELKSKISRSDLEQLAQRVSVYYHLNGLGESEISQYIKYRLKAGGARNLNIFTQNAIKTIREFSRCNPRIINIICDNALIYGFTESAKVIDESIIAKCIKDREEAEFFLYTDKKRTTASLEAKFSNFQSIDKRLSFIEARLANIEILLDSQKLCAEKSVNKDVL